MIVMKRIVLGLMLVICMGFLTSCSDSSMAKEKRLMVATDQYPVYDFLTEVFSKDLDVTLVKLQSDKNAEKADLFVCINSDGYFENVFEIKKEIEMDGENVWMSPQKAIDAFYVIYNKVVNMDSTLEAKHREEYDNYVVTLQNINTKMKSLANGKSLIIADDVNLDVLKKDYGFKIKTLGKTGSVVALVSDMKKENCSAVYYLKGGSNEVANVAGNMTNSYVLPVELCTIRDLKEIKKGISYIKMLENNTKNFAMR